MLLLLYVYNKALLIQDVGLKTLQWPSQDHCQHFIIYSKPQMVTWWEWSFWSLTNWIIMQTWDATNEATSYHRPYYAPISITYQLEGMQRPNRQSWFSATTTEEGETSHYQENSTDAIKNGCVFKAEREIHPIMTHSWIQSRCTIGVLAGICFSLPLHGQTIMSEWIMHGMW